MTVEINAAEMHKVFRPYQDVLVEANEVTSCRPWTAKETRRFAVQHTRWHTLWFLGRFRRRLMRAPFNQRVVIQNCQLTADDPTKPVINFGQYVGMSAVIGCYVDTRGGSR